jgi:SAM-dependent methyltransferase
VRIKNALKKVLNSMGHPTDPRLKVFKEELEKLKALNNEARFLNSDFEEYPCLTDKTALTSFDAHYIYHPAWAARIVKAIAPEKHIDISSTLHFCSILSAFIPTEFYDYRPADLNLDNLVTSHADLTNLHYENNSIQSLSCMHTIEHIGLGRYGDPIDPDGDLKAFSELKRVCAINGNLLIVVPVGVRKVQFNAHRIYNPHDIINYMNGFKVQKFSLVNDKGKYIENADLDDAATQQYGCGCYWFIKDKI